MLNKLLYLQNLKKYQYHYWFGFPALNPLEPVTLLSEPVTISDKLSAKQVCDNYTLILTRENSSRTMNNKTIDWVSRDIARS